MTTDDTGVAPDVFVKSHTIGLLAAIALSVGAHVDSARADRSVRMPGWAVVQQPPSDAWISRTSAPGDPSDPSRPLSPVMRVELGPTALLLSGEEPSARAEVYGRTPPSMSGTPAERWPDPVGSIRWYSFDLLIPEGFDTPEARQWITLTQWKGYRGGSPPVALEIKNQHLRLGGARANAGVIPLSLQDLGPIDFGRWTSLAIGLRLSPDPRQGWVEVRRDGRVVVPRIAVATMDRINGQIDPIYLKQGLYRPRTWQTRHVAYFSSVIVGHSPVGNADRR